MKILRSGVRYSADNTDLIADIIKVQYQTEEYAKVKMNLINKKNGIVYEVRRNYKIYKKNITHWKRYEKE